MDVGETLFAQVMESVPWKTFGRINERYGGDAGVRTLDSADLFRVMVVSQLTWRESLRDIGACRGHPPARRDHDRSVLEPVRWGTVSFDQGGGQDAHAAGLARRHSRLHPHPTMIEFDLLRRIGGKVDENVELKQKTTSNSRNPLAPLFLPAIYSSRGMAFVVFHNHMEIER